jgi:PAS domain S-box-containing protein
VAVVFASLDLAWVSAIAAESELPPGSTLTVFDHNGTILARVPDGEAWVGQTEPEAEIVRAALAATGEQSIEAAGVDGVEKVYGIVPFQTDSPVAQAYLTVGIPIDQVYAPVMAVERSQLIGLILATALAAVGAWFVGERFVVRRVDAILRATRQIGLGHLEARTGVAGGEDELARLAHEFDAMADQLEARESALMEATSELRRVNRALVILSACNQVLIRSAEDRSMAQQICQTIVGQGGFRLAWVGLAEQDNSHNLQVLGQAGPATGYLEETPLTWGGDPARRGPGATAFRTGKTAVVRDVWKDDVTPEWRRLASKYGVASAIGLPLHRAGHVIGALSIYAGQPEAFDLEEVRLLTELADDLSFGLETLRKDAERQRAQADVIRLEAFHRGIVENVAEGIAVFDEEGHFTFANSAADGMLAYDPGELLGRHWKSVVAPGDHLGVAARREGLGRGEVDRYEVTLMRKDGQPVQFRVSASSLFEGGERAGTLSVFNDVTTERKYQRRAELQERLAAVGQLAAGIAHDFNNIVGAIILFGELLLAEKGFSEASRERIRLIVDQAHRAAELTQQILDFGRKSIVERRPTDLLRFLREFERLVGRTLPEPITVRIEAADSEYIVDADPGRMQQALLNLALNARDAMPEGGVISFRLARLEVREEAPPYRDMRPGSWVMLSVSDTGTGIPAEILPHVFEPFYTTKPVGEGTGLGLSQVYGIVKQHDGYIDVQSTPGQGTTFMAYFPVTTASLSEAHAAGQAVDVQGNGETILVVEDDEAARNALGETLLRMNYKIVLAEDGAQALELFEAAREQIALVISDVVMPRIGGMELFRELRKLNPEVRALLVTGYPLGKDTRELLEAGKAGWIQKPFDSRTLGTRIRLMLRL